VLELKARPRGPRRRLRIESSLEKGLGAIATVLVLRGTLKLCDPLLIGQEFGRVRAGCSTRPESRSMRRSSSGGGVGLSGARCRR